jgi:hypothetical protein
MEFAVSIFIQGFILIIFIQMDPVFLAGSLSSFVINVPRYLRHTIITLVVHAPPSYQKSFLLNFFSPLVIVIMATHLPFNKYHIIRRKVICHSLLSQLEYFIIEAIIILYPSIINLLTQVNLSTMVNLQFKVIL